MSSKIKPGLFFGIFMAIFFISEHLISAKIHTTTDIAETITIGIFSGAIGGLLFGFLTGKLSSSKFVKNPTKDDIDEGK